MAEGGEYGYEDDPLDTTTPANATNICTACVWERMANNISKDVLRADAESAVEQLLAGLAREVACATPRLNLQFDHPPPDWKDLAKWLLRERDVETSDDGFEARWKAATRRPGSVVHGCEVLIHLSKQSDPRAHDALCREAVWGGRAGAASGGPVHTRTTLSEHDLARYTMLMCADDIVVVQRKSSRLKSFVYWTGDAWSEQTAGAPNVFSRDTFELHHALLRECVAFHYRCVQQAVSRQLGADIVRAAERRLLAARKAKDSHGSLRHSRVRATIFRMMSALSVPESPFDANERLQAFSNGLVVDLQTKQVRAVERRDLVL